MLDVVQSPEPLQRRRNVLASARTFVHAYILAHAVRLFYNRIYGTSIGKGSRISLSAKIDKTNPRGVHIGEDTAVSFDVAVLTHDFVNGHHKPVHIGSNCFIGARSIIMPGISIGDHCIVGAASVVMRDVPARCVVMGNPAKIIEQNIQTGRWGKRHGPTS